MIEEIISNLNNIGISNIITKNNNADFLIDYLLLNDTILITDNKKHHHTHKYIIQYNMDEVDIHIINLLRATNKKSIIIDLVHYSSSIINPILRANDERCFYNEIFKISCENKLSIIIINTYINFQISQKSNHSLLFKKDTFEIIKSRCLHNSEYQTSNLYSYITNKMRREKLKRILEESNELITNTSNS